MNIDETMGMENEHLFHHALPINIS